jgi:hypothetical protein
MGEKEKSMRSRRIDCFVKFADDPGPGLEYDSGLFLWTERRVVEETKPRRLTFPEAV